MPVRSLILRTILRFLLPALLLVFSGAVASAQPLTTATAVKALNSDKVQSLQRATSVLATLEASVKRALTANKPNYPLQEALITSAGGLVSPLFELASQSGQSQRRSQALFVRNQALLNRVLEHHQQVIRHYQENLLDQMADTSRFFLSDDWQMPQKLISLASYWLGWNGYYTSLLMPAESDERQNILNQAVAGFSRSFIDFQEDEVTTRSLYGRGLVYGQLRLFGRAAYDFKSVREKVGRDDSLYLNCLYQEAVISHELGRDQVASQLLAAIQENYPPSDIPAAVRVGIKKLQTQMMLATRASPAVAAATSPRGPDEIIAEFNRLRQLAAGDPDLFTELYNYAHDHAEVLSELTNEQLSPAGALAVADWYFEQQNFDRALPMYQQLKTNRPRAVKGQQDRIWLNLAHIENSRQNWPAVLGLLGKFSATFPKSGQLDTAAAFYYRAAVASYRQSASQRNYQTYIKATQNYVKHCQACDGISDAQFALGQYYQQRDQIDRAVAAFSRVKPDSNHYFVASYWVAMGHLAALEAHARGAELPPGFSVASRLAQVRKRVNQYRTGGQQSTKAQPLRAHWIVLMGRYYLVGEKPDHTAALAAVDGFETRFVNADAFLPEIVAIRAAAYQGLNQSGPFVEQVDRLGEMARQNPQAYGALQRLAERLYAELVVEQGARGWIDAAVAAYQPLLSVSIANSDYQTYLPRLYSQLGMAYRLSGRQTEAIALYQQWLTADGESADALLAMAESYVEINQWQNAVQTWRRLTDGLPSGSEAWFNARYQTAVAYLQLNRSDRACTIATMVRVLYPASQPEYAEKFAVLERDNCPQNQAVPERELP